MFNWSLGRTTHCVFFLLFMGVNVGGVWASNPVDSLLKVVKESHNPQVLGDAFIHLADHYKYRDYKKSISYANRARVLSDSVDNPRRYVSALYLLTEAYIFSGEYDYSAELIQKMEAIAQKHNFQDVIAQCHHGKGIIHFVKGERDIALVEYHAALEINDSLNLREPMLKQLNNISLVLRDEGKFDLALEYITRCLEMAQDPAFIRYQAAAQGNISYIYTKQKKFREALPHIRKSISLSNNLGDSIRICMASYLLADAHLNLANYDSAHYSASNALALANSLDYDVGKVFSLRILSDVAIANKDFEQAKQYAYQAKEIAHNTSSYLYYQDVLNSIYQAEKGAQNYLAALQAHEELNAIKDSMVQAEVKEKIEQSEFKYAAQQKEQENQLLRIQKRQSQRLSWISILVLALVVTVAYLLYNAYLQSKQYGKKLETAINERTQELMASNRELERFTFIVSHDLKEPIRNIMGFSSLINRSIQEQDLKNLDQYASIVSTNGKQMETLLDDIMRFSIVRDTKQLNIQVIDLNALMAEIQRLISGLLAPEHIHLQIDPLPTIQADKSLMIILFKNLIENAIKYNDKTTIHIHMYAEELDSGYKISVQDNGIGMDEKYKSMVFEMFKRLHNRATYQGSGLGLATCKKIADLHQYQLDFESTLGVGTRFFLITS